MKKILLFMLAGFLFSCVPTTETGEEPTTYRPILMARADFEKTTRLEPAKEIGTAGKIYSYQNLLFINEPYEGVHVFDNSDPTNPTAMGFIKILGNIDISIVDGVIYADNSVDLIALQYDGSTIEILSRQRNVFPEVVPPDFGTIPQEYLPENRPENTVIIRWEEFDPS